MSINRLLSLTKIKDKLLENFVDKECEISRALFLNDNKHIGTFWNLHQGTFKQGKGKEKVSKQSQAFISAPVPLCE